VLQSSALLTMVVVGDIRTDWGPVVGAVLLERLLQMIAYLDLPPSILGPAEGLLGGGRAVLRGRGVQACDIAVRDGRIAALLASGAGVDAAETLDISGLVVLPGAIDVHLHLSHGKGISRPRVPGDADRESAAAAMGGITAFVPYLMATDPFETLFDEVAPVTAAGPRIDFGYHFIISTEAQLAVLRGGARRPQPEDFSMNNRCGKAMGRGHVKGAISPGLDADFAAIDPAARWTLTRDGVMSAAG